MKKQISALLAASAVTILIALIMAVTGANALFNKNGVDPSNRATSGSTATASSQQVEQLQQRIDEYAQREQQYQQRDQQYQQMLQNDQAQLQQAADEMRQVQQLLFALQSRGLIRVQSNGTIAITGGSGN